MFGETGVKQPLGRAVDAEAAGFTQVRTAFSREREDGVSSES